MCHGQSMLLMNTGIGVDVIEDVAAGQIVTITEGEHAR